jgi:DinB superfamily
MLRTAALLLTLAALAPLHAQDNLTTTGMKRYFDPIRHNLEAAADAMPADKYSYRLTPDQMSFGEWIIHSAQRNFNDCATLKSEKPPVTAEQLAALKDKAEIAKALKDSFAYCDTALNGITDQKALASPQTAYAFLHILIHNNEIYGNIVGYLRTSGIVPPSTAARGNQKSKK